MMSADGESDIIAQFLRNGADEYLIKPIKPQIVKSLMTYVKLSKKTDVPNSSKDEYKYIKDVYFNYRCFF